MDEPAPEETSARSVPDEIPSDCLIYRMVKVRDIKDDGTPSSSAFSDNPRDIAGAEHYMSVYAHDELVANGWSVQKLAEQWGPEYRPYALTAGELRAKGERLWRAPMGEVPGHAACKRSDDGKRTGGQKRELARRSRPVELTDR